MDEGDPRATIGVPSEYRCPLCSSGAPGAAFRPSEIAGAPICEGCSQDLSWLLELDERQGDSVLDRLEAFTGLSFKECRRRYYREAVRIFRYMLDPENVDNAVADEVGHTGRSREATVAHWQHALEEYEAALRMLEA